MLFRLGFWSISKEDSILHGVHALGTSLKLATSRTWQSVTLGTQSLGDRSTWHSVHLALSLLGKWSHLTLSHLALGHLALRLLRTWSLVTWSQHRYDNLLTSF